MCKRRSVGHAGTPRGRGVLNTLIVTHVLRRSHDPMLGPSLGPSLGPRFVTLCGFLSRLAVSPTCLDALIGHGHSLV